MKVMGCMPDGVTLKIMKNLMSLQANWGTEVNFLEQSPNDAGVEGGEQESAMRESTSTIDHGPQSEAPVAENPDWWNTGRKGAGTCSHESLCRWCDRSYCNTNRKER
jgi:hypothetical protein